MADRKIALADGVWQISINGNAFIIDGDEGITLVDTGMPGSHGKITEALRQIGRSANDVKSIVITHGHSDHFGAAASLKRASGARVISSETEAPILERKAPIPPPPFLGPFGFLSRIFPAAKAVQVDHEVPSGEPTSTVADLSVIETPGHTEGHISLLLDRAGGILFVGDAAVAGKNGEVKRGFMNRAGEVFDGSLRRLAGYDFEIACFGHSRPIEVGAGGAFRRFVDDL